MAAMTAPDLSAPADAGRGPDEPREVWVSVVLVVALTVVHLAMAYSVSTLPDLISDLMEPWAGQSRTRLFIYLLPALPLALVVLGAARTVLRGTAACVVVVGVTVLAYNSDSVWLVTALLPTGAALAWGIARRRGQVWWLGLVVAVITALVMRKLDLDAFADDESLHDAFLAFVLHVLPAVLGGLACWFLELLGRVR
jgi:hypothetical protein